MVLKASFYEIAKTNSTNSWSLEGKNCLVKVVTPLSEAGDRIGYVTQEKYIQGLTPMQIERDLGLKPRMLETGAKVYRLLRLLDLHEFECKLSTCFPGGSVFEWENISGSQFQERNFWPPGKGFPQWDINAQIPTRLIRSLLPYEPY